ncbi:MAG: DUF1440 domain-containing protein [Acidobacteria bacterium]|nr:DUF1440 domain-containing protein [Acidobacteriota bacterium]MCA1610493.1 DUF1440 domain-containing protein [Acidobacteriota bacterium]
MSATADRARTGRNDMWKGALAGLVGGLVASFVMNRFQELLTAAAVGRSRARFHFEQGGQIKKSARHRPWSLEKSESATSKAANALSRLVRGRSLHGRKRQRAGRALHYGFGAISGAAYGALAEHFSSVTVGRGTAFGTLVWLVADEMFVPVAGLSKSPDKYPGSAHAQSLAAHLVYGATTEAVRRPVRTAL